MANYTKLTSLTTNYAMRMKRLSNSIFGNVKRPTQKAEAPRVVRMFSEEPIYMQDKIINHYPRHSETGMLMRKLREYGLFRDEHEDFTEEMRRLRALRGKGLRRNPKKKD